MRRFFFRQEERAGDQVILSASESHHIRRVLRLRVGAKVELFDGSGGVHQAELMEIGERVRVLILSSATIPADDRISIRVGQGLLKAKNMDTVVQKYTELGVHCLIPVLSSRCQGRPDLTREGKKRERWLKIIDQSCKQCKRTRPMELLEIMDFHQLTSFLDSGEADLKILFWEEESAVSLHDLLPLRDVGRVQVLLGPEGGFSREEVAMAREAGWQTVSLGRRILRAETAALASVAILQFLLGEI